MTRNDYYGGVRKTADGRFQPCVYRYGATDPVATGRPQRRQWQARIMAESMTAAWQSQSDGR